MKKKKSKKKENKFIIVGAGNDGFKHRIEIRKNESFKEAFIALMLDLGFDKKFDYIDSVFMTEENYSSGSGRDVKVKDVSDIFSQYQNKDFEVEIFYGVKKIFLIIRTKKRAKLIKTLERYSKWVKPKKFPKLKSKKKK